MDEEPEISLVEEYLLDSNERNAHESYGPNTPSSTNAGPATTQRTSSTSTQHPLASTSPSRQPNLAGLVPDTDGWYRLDVRVSTPDNNSRTKYPAGHFNGACWSKGYSIFIWRKY